MHEVKPKAELIGGSNYGDNIKRIWQGYRRCYSNKEGVVQSHDYPEMEAFIRKMLKAEHPHASPLEHASLTFHVTCSRACSHQLVRHRLASYSQQSQRYVRMDDLPVIVPPKVKEQEGLRKIFENTVRHIEAQYDSMLHEWDIPAEDARAILPNCVATQIVVTMNFRSLLHFFAERCCNRAQWEIRDIANQMLEQCKQLYPCVFENVGPHCMKLKHCPESKPCGKNPWKKE